MLSDLACLVLVQKQDSQRINKTLPDLSCLQETGWIQQQTWHMSSEFYLFSGVCLQLNNKLRVLLIIIWVNINDHELQQQLLLTHSNTKLQIRYLALMDWPSWWDDFEWLKWAQHWIILLYNWTEASPLGPRTT